MANTKYLQIRRKRFLDANIRHLAFYCVNFSAIRLNLISTVHKINNELKFCPTGTLGILDLYHQIMMWKNCWMMIFEWVWTLSHDIRFISLKQTFWGIKTNCCGNEAKFDKETPNIMWNVAWRIYNLSDNDFLFVSGWARRNVSAIIECTLSLETVSKRSSFKLQNYTIGNKFQTSTSFLASRSLSET